MKRPTLLRRLARSDRGAALVEFAMVLPIILLLFAVIIEGGRMMWSYQSAISGVRDATRFLARVEPTSACPTPPAITSARIATLEDMVRRSIQNGSVMRPGVQLDPNGTQKVSATITCVTGTFRLPSTPVATVSARVRIDFPFAGIFAFASDGFPTFLVTTITDQSRVFGS